jgi:hypothetical protein
MAAVQGYTPYPLTVLMTVHHDVVAVVDGRGEHGRV